jgi:hypothetical protein
VVDRLNNSSSARRCGHGRSQQVVLLCHGNSSCQHTSWHVAPCFALMQQQHWQHHLSRPAAHSYSTAASTLHAELNEHRQVQHQASQQDEQQDPASPAARVLDGKAVAAAWSEQLQQQVPELTNALGRPPGLAVVLVGSRPDSMLYVTKKEEACMRIGVNCRCDTWLLHCLHCCMSSMEEHACSQHAYAHQVASSLHALQILK